MGGKGTLSSGQKKKEMCVKVCNKPIPKTKENTVSTLHSGEYKSSLCTAEGFELLCDTSGLGINSFILICQHH